MIEMIIIWSVIIAVALLIEFLTYDLVSSWFAVGGIGALILAACKVEVWWQIFVFFVIALACIIFIRKYLKKFLHAPTVPTNVDVNVGQKADLLKDVKDGRSEIKINDIIWTVSCEDKLKQGDSVIIIGMAGNKFIVRDANAAPVNNIKKEKKVK